MYGDSFHSTFEALKPRIDTKDIRKKLVFSLYL